jgi:hypothetical protein
VYCTLRCTFTVYFLSCACGSKEFWLLEWVRGRKMIQVLLAFGLLDFTMLRPVLAWRAFWNLWTFVSLIFHFFSGRGKPWILNQWIRGTTILRVRKYRPVILFWTGRKLHTPLFCNWEIFIWFIFPVNNRHWLVLQAFGLLQVVPCNVIGKCRLGPVCLSQEDSLLCW